MEPKLSKAGAKEILCIVVYTEEDTALIADHLSKGYEILSAVGCARFIVYYLHKK